MRHMYGSIDHVPIPPASACYACAASRVAYALGHRRLAGQHCPADAATDAYPAFHAAHCSCPPNLANASRICGATNQSASTASAGQREIVQERSPQD